MDSSLFITKLFLVLKSFIKGVYFFSVWFYFLLTVDKLCFLPLDSVFFVDCMCFVELGI